ncbi:hypothetical protein PIB30_108710, partial [Stylosanthes scabra]|nr:hypothetical protein [Stylosanthes scabra]
AATQPLHISSRRRRPWCSVVASEASAAPSYPSPRSPSSSSKKSSSRRVRFPSSSSSPHFSRPWSSGIVGNMAVFGKTPSTNRVNALVLDGLSLSGNIDRGLLRLQNLQILSLARNNFTGSINPDLTSLRNLQVLDSLQHCRILPSAVPTAKPSVDYFIDG